MPSLTSLGCSGIRAFYLGPTSPWLDAVTHSACIEPPRHRLFGRGFVRFCKARQKHACLFVFSVEAEMIGMLTRGDDAIGMCVRH